MDKTKINALIVVTISVIFVAIVFFSPGPFVVSGSVEGSVVDGLVCYGLGGAFLLSFFYEKQFKVCQLIMGICTWVMWPSSRKWAFVYCAVFWIIGTIMILK